MLDDEIKYFDETGSLGFLFLKKKTQDFHCKMFNAVLEIFEAISWLNI